MRRIIIAAFFVACLPCYAGSQPEVILAPETSDKGDPMAANMALPEDAILIGERFVIADTQNGYVREVSGGEITIAAGNGKLNPSSDRVQLDVADKAFPVLSVLPHPDGYLSFSSSGAGVNMHSAEGVRFLTNSYVESGGHHTLSHPKFSLRKDGEIYLFDSAPGKNHLLGMEGDQLEHIPLDVDLSGETLMGFGMCGEDLIYSVKGGDGRVVFSRLGEDGTQTELFFDRPYSNAIHCLGPNDFLYGARWELKRYRDGQIAVVADQFVHIAAIREGRGDSVVVTDSDSESVVIVNPETGRKEVIATSKGQMLGDPLVKLQRVGSNVYGMTPDGTLIRYNLERDATTVLLSITGQGEWDQLLRGHELKAPRAFVLDPGTLALYVAVNHGIFRLSTRTRKLELYAGSENHYGYADGPREQARFAVIRDLELHGRTLYVADAWNDRVRAIDLASGEVSTVAGSGRNEYKNRNDGCSPALEYNLNRPLAIEVFDGRLIVANSYSHYLVSVAEGDACPFAGAPRPSNNQYGGDHVDGNKASFNGPRELSATTKGLLVADMWNNAIRAVDENGTVSTVYQHDKLARFPSDVVSYRGNIIYSSSDATLKSVRGQ